MGRNSYRLFVSLLQPGRIFLPRRFFHHENFIGSKMNETTDLLFGQYSSEDETDKSSERSSPDPVPVSGGLYLGNSSFPRKANIKF